MNAIEIIKLKQRPEFTDQIIKFLFSEWGDKNFNFWSSWVRSSMSDQIVPGTYIALVHGQLAGTYSLWCCDLQSRQDLTPWFGGLYVHKDYRGQEYHGEKLGTTMLNHAINELRKTTYQKAYLFTDKKGNYYDRHGWEFMELIPNEKDEMVGLYSYSLTD